MYFALGPTQLWPYFSEVPYLEVRPTLDASYILEDAHISMLMPKGMALVLDLVLAIGNLIFMVSSSNMSSLRLFVSQSKYVAKKSRNKKYDVSSKFVSGQYLVKFSPWLISGQCSHFISPENPRKPKVIWYFQGGIKWDHWPEMGQQAFMQGTKYNSPSM